MASLLDFVLPKLMLNNFVLNYVFRWFHPEICRKEAEEMLSSKGPGTYFCQQSSQENKYVLTVK